MRTGTRDETALVTEETGLLEEPRYEWLSPLEIQCKVKLTTCSVSIACSYECATVIETPRMSTFLMNVNGDVAFATDHHFDRKVTTNFLPILPPCEIGGVLVSLGEKAPITRSQSKPIPLPKLFPNSGSSDFYPFPCTRTAADFINLDPIHQDGFSHVIKCLNNFDRIWMSCRSAYHGLHQFSLRMSSSLAWLYSLIGRHLHGGGVTCTDMLTYSFTPGRDDAY